MDCQHTDCFRYKECIIKDMAQYCSINNDFFNLDKNGKKIEEEAVKQ